MNTNHKPYTPRPWQLPHLLATPIGGTVLLVERCKRQPPEDCREVFCLYGPDKDGRMPTESEQGAYRITHAGDVDWMFDCPLGPIGTVLAVKESVYWNADADNFYFAIDKQGVGNDRYRSLKKRFAEQLGNPATAMLSAEKMPLKYCRLFFRTTGIDLRKFETMTDQEARLWGSDTIKMKHFGQWLIDTNNADPSEWAWFVTLERINNAIS